MQCGLDNKRSRCVVSHRFSDLNDLSTLFIPLGQRTMISESCDASRLQILCDTGDLRTAADITFPGILACCHHQQHEADEAPG